MSPDVLQLRNMIDPDQLVDALPFANWSTDQPGILHLNHQSMRASISAWGGQLLEWQPRHSAASALWLSKQAIYPTAPYQNTTGKAIRGGVPISWPWFANEFPKGISKPAHGFARTSWWQLTALHDHGGGITCTWRCQDTPTTYALWPHRFALELQMLLGEKCQLSLHISNTDSQAWSWSGALHSYFAINTSQAGVDGLQGLAGYDKLTQKNIASFPEKVKLTSPHDHIVFAQHGANDPHGLSDPQIVHLKDGNTAVGISSTGHNSVVIWNISKTTAEGMTDVADEAWQNFACIESSWAGGRVHNLNPGQSHTLTTEIQTSNQP
jgi:glucose-6-phosphate 1-epimerase